MKAVFVELPAFSRHRERYLSDAEFSQLQRVLLENPVAGDVLQGTGGIRKIRFADGRRGKGRRGGLRVIYYWWQSGPEFWLFTIYSKNEMRDLAHSERKAVREMVKAELARRIGA